MPRDDRTRRSVTRRQLLRVVGGSSLAALAACQYPAGRGPAPPRPGPGAGGGGGGGASASWAARLYADHGAAVSRGGHPVPYAHGMTLWLGDEVETDAANFALIEFRDGDGVYMKPETRVRLGSIFVFFGEIFNRIVSGSGFRAESDVVEAGVEETEFVMHVDRASHATTVTVNRGVVRCTARVGTWRAQVLKPNQRLIISRQLAVPPKVQVLQPAEIRATTRWAEEVSGRIRIPPRQLEQAPQLREPQRLQQPQQPKELQEPQQPTLRTLPTTPVK
jgi:hypothetical protein